MKKQWSLILFSIFYGIAGTMHFINPDIYLQVIPDYLDDAVLLNYLAGIAELLIAITIWFRPLRNYAVYGTILMLIAFIPAHVYFLQIGSCAGELCIPAWIGWLRLIIIHPLLIYWAWSLRSKN